MKRIFQNLFCVLTVCAVVSFVGCNKKDADKKGAGADKGGDTAQNDGDKKDK